MKIGQVTLKMMVFTIGCFLLSYTASVLGNINGEKPYPKSLAKIYATKGGRMSEISLNKNLPAQQARELILQSTSTDIDIKPVEGENVTLELQGEVPEGQD